MQAIKGLARQTNNTISDHHFILEYMGQDSSYKNERDMYVGILCKMMKQNF